MIDCSVITLAHSCHLTILSFKNEKLKYYSNVCLPSIWQTQKELSLACFWLQRVGYKFETFLNGIRTCGLYVESQSPLAQSLITNHLFNCQLATLSVSVASPAKALQSYFTTLELQWLEICPHYDYGGVNYKCKALMRSTTVVFYCYLSCICPCTIHSSIIDALTMSPVT